LKKLNSSVFAKMDYRVRVCRGKADSHHNVVVLAFLFLERSEPPFSQKGNPIQKQYCTVPALYLGYYCIYSIMN
jgi:hypothetical protein